MRRVCAIALCSLGFLLAVPTGAHAWWEFFEGLSGPRLHGPHIEGRFVCFMGPFTDSSGAEDEAGKNYRSIGVITPCIWRVGEGTRRKASIDLGVRFLTDRNPETTGGPDIKFVSFEPVITWSPITRYDRDWVEGGFGAGMYWFSSEAFTSFRGAFLEPLRLDVHVPSSWRAKSKWMVLVPTGRIGLLVFPRGFEPNAFAGPGQTTPRMPGEAVKYGGFFFDLEALFN